MSNTSHRYPPELKERAIRLVGEVRDQYDSEWTAIESVASKLGIGSAETLRKWIRRSEIDAGKRPGVTTDESAEMRKLRAEVQRRIHSACHDLTPAEYEQIYYGQHPALTEALVPTS